MKIKDRPEFESKPKPLSFPADALVADAVAAMSERRYGSVIVTGAEGKLEGLVTERDIMTRVVNQGRDPRQTRLSDIMTRDVRVANADDNLLDWLRIMSNERFRRLPVVDGNGDAVAIMTQGDFVSYTWPDLLYQGRQVVKATVSANYQIAYIVGAVMVYTLIVIFALGAVL